MSGYERNVFYANNRDGTFSDVSGAVGLDFIEDGRSFALADFDHDGRLEVFLKNRNGPQLRLLRNVMQELPPSIAFRLRGSKSSRDAIGAAITVETESGSRPVCFRPVQDFFRNTARKYFSDWEKPKVRCGRLSAGPADWFRRSVTFHLITGYGSKKVLPHREWRHSRVV